MSEQGTQLYDILFQSTIEPGCRRHYVWVSEIQVFNVKFVTFYLFPQWICELDVDIMVLSKNVGSHEFVAQKCITIPYSKV